MSINNPLEQRFLIIGQYDVAFSKSLDFAFKKNFAKFEPKSKYVNTASLKKEQLMLEILEFQPDCIFVEIVKEELDKDVIKTIEYLRQDPKLSKVIVCGLCENVKNPNLFQYFNVGMNMAFSKGDPVEDMLHNILSFKYEDKVTPQGYAVANLDEKNITKRLICNVFNPIVSLNKQEMTVESFLNIKEGSKEIIRNSKFFTKELGISTELLATEVRKGNLFYNSSKAIDFKLIYCNDARLEEEFRNMVDLLPAKEKGKMTEDDMRKQKLQLKKILDKKSSMQIQKWLKKSQFGSDERELKVLVIDSKGNYFQKYASIKKYKTEKKISVKSITGLVDANLDIEKFYPDIILYQYDEDEDKKLDRVYQANGNATLARIISAIKRLGLANTAIVLFGCPYKIDAIKDSMSFQKIVGTADPLNLSWIEKFADLYLKRSKLKKNLNSSNLAEDVGITYFFNKNERSNFLKLSRSAKMIMLSESYVIIESEEHLPYGFPLQVSNPYNMWITLVPSHGIEMKNNKGMKRYKALVHSITEEERKKIRRYVNDIFFSFLNKEHEADSLEFFKVKLDYLDDQIDSLTNKIDSIKTKFSGKLPKEEADFVKQSEAECKTFEVTKNVLIGDFLKDNPDKTEFIEEYNRERKKNRAV